MTTTERTARVMEADPRIRAAFPGWFWPHCGACGDECDTDINDDPFCLDCATVDVVYKFGPPTQGHGPDVWASLDMTDPPNLHHAFAAADLFSANRANEYITGDVARNRGESLLWFLENQLH